MSRSYGWLYGNLQQRLVLIPFDTRIQPRRFTAKLHTSPSTYLHWRNWTPSTQCWLRHGDFGLHWHHHAAFYIPSGQRPSRHRPLLANFSLLFSCRLSTCPLPLSNSLNDSTTFAKNWLPHLGVNYSTPLCTGYWEDIRITRYNDTHQQL